MKSILVVNIGTNIGGIEKCLINFLRFLVDEGHKVSLATWKKPGELDDQIPEGVIRLPRLGPGEFKNILKQKRGLSLFRSLVGYVRFKLAARKGHAWKSLSADPTKYDVAISFCQNGYSPYYVIDKVNAAHKYLFYHHGSYEKTEADKQRDAQYYAQYDAVVTVSNANKTMLCEHFPKLCDAIKVIPNLSDESSIRDCAAQKVPAVWKKGCKITTVGRISPEKGQLLAIETAKQLKEQNFDFTWVIVGDGPDRQACEEKIQAYGLQACCLLLGAQTNPYPYIEQADLYVQTSSVEADPVTIREAKILKKHIIASDIPAVREALSEGELGQLCALDAESFAKAIVSAYDDALQPYLSALESMGSVNEQSIQKIRKLLEA